MSKSKQVIVIRKDLNMRKGKMCSQASHASMKVILDMMKDDENGNKTLKLNKNTAIEMWINGIFTKITVSVDSESELDDAYNKALSLNLPCSMIIDAGLTEFGGVPTKTAVAIGPAWSDSIDEITGKLKLL